MFRGVLRIALLGCALFAPLAWVMLPLGRALPSSGSIAFGAERYGSRDIFVGDIDRGMVYRLTRQPGDEWFGAWSLDGRQFAYRAQEPNAQLVVSRLGTRDKIVFHPDSDFAEGLALSPDGGQLAVIIGRLVPDLFVYTLNQPTRAGVQLTNEPGRDAYPAWLPDGEHLIFASWMNGDSDIYRIGADGLVNLTQHPAEDASPALSPDGTQIAFYSLRSGARELYVMDADGGNLRALTAYDDIYNGDYWNPPVWSPDGKRVAMTAVFGGAPEIVAVDVETGAAERLTHSIGLDLARVWLPDNQRLIVASSVGGTLQLHVLDTQGNSRPLGIHASTEYAALWPPY